MDMHVLMFLGYFQKRELHHGDEFYIVYKKGEEEKSKPVSYIDDVDIIVLPTCICTMYRYTCKAGHGC
jgi:hypothetical protein